MSLCDAPAHQRMLDSRPVTAAHDGPSGGAPQGNGGPVYVCCCTMPRPPVVLGLDCPTWVCPTEVLKDLPPVVCSSKDCPKDRSRNRQTAVGYPSTAIGCQPPSVILQSPSGTLPPPSVALHLQSVTLPPPSVTLPPPSATLPCNRHRLPCQRHWLPCHRHRLRSNRRTTFDGRQRFPPPALGPP